MTAEVLASIQWPAEVECQPAPDSPLVGQWKGHWPEQVPQGSHDLVLTISGLTPDGVPCGTARIGEGLPPSPATDPDAPYPDPSVYPAGYGYSTGGSTFGLGPPAVEAWPGFEYRMLNVQSSGTRLAFMITYGELLRSWCALQPAYPGSFSCLPEFMSGEQNGSSCIIWGAGLPRTEVPCFKMQYCVSYSCFCYDGTCDASRQAAQTLFELHWDGPALEGSVNGQTLIFLDPVAP